MSFEGVAKRIMKKQGVSMDRARAMLAAGTRRNMAKHGITSKRIPKGIWKRIRKRMA